jgi:hypothetical protein
MIFFAVSEAEQPPNVRSISKQNNRFNFDVVNGRQKASRTGMVSSSKNSNDFDSSVCELYLFAVLKHYGMQDPRYAKQKARKL